MCENLPTEIHNVGPEILIAVPIHSISANKTRHFTENKQFGSELRYVEGKDEHALTYDYFEGKKGDGSISYAISEVIQKVRHAIREVLLQCDFLYVFSGSFECRSEGTW